MAYRVGLTGGIGSGKSTVSSIFSRLGVPVIDADQIARSLVEPGTDALSKLTAHFGEEILNQGQLDRRRLRELIFTDEAAKEWVEALLHPLVKREMLSRADQQDSAYVVLEIPLLFEAGYQNLLDRVLVIDVPPALQVDRVVSRDEVLQSQVESVIRAQISAKARLKQANDVIENTGSLEQLREQVESLHRKYLEMARIQP